MSKFQSKSLSNSGIAGAYMRLKSAGTRFDSVGLHHLWQHSSVGERSLHTGNAECSIHSAATNLFRCRIMALRLAVNQVILDRSQSPEPFIPGSSKGRTPASEAANARSNRASGSMLNPASSKGRKADFESVNRGSIPRAGTIPAMRQCNKVNLGEGVADVVRRWIVNPFYRMQVPALSPKLI